MASFKLYDIIPLGDQKYQYRYMDKDGNIVARVNPKRKRKCVIEIITLDGVAYYYRKIKGESITAYRIDDTTKYYIGCISLDGDKYYYINNRNLYSSHYDCGAVYTKEGKIAFTNHRWYDAPPRTQKLRSMPIGNVELWGDKLTLSFAIVCLTTGKIMRVNVLNVYSVNLFFRSDSYIMFQITAIAADNMLYYFGDERFKAGFCDSGISLYLSHRMDGKKIYNWLPDHLCPSVMSNVEVISTADIDFNQRPFAVYMNTLTVYNKDGILII